MARARESARRASSLTASSGAQWSPCWSVCPRPTRSRLRPLEGASISTRVLFPPMRRAPSRTPHRGPSFPISWRRLLLAILCLAGEAVPSTAQTGANALVCLQCSRVPIARQLADEYLQSRQVPPLNLLAIETDPAVEISRATYERQIEAPIARALQRATCTIAILYIVLIKGVPLRIAGTPPPEGTLSSVDSELTLVTGG